MIATKYIVYAGALLFILSTVYGTFSYISNLNQEISTLESDNIQLNTEVAEHKMNIDRLNESIEDREQRNLELQDNLRSQRQAVEELRATFMDHDLDNLLQNKPGLVLNILNEGTKDFYDEVKEATSEK